MVTNDIIFIGRFEHEGVIISSLFVSRTFPPTVSDILLSISRPNAQKVFVEYSPLALHDNTCYDMTGTLDMLLCDVFDSHVLVNVLCFFIVFVA